MKWDCSSFCLLSIELGSEDEDASFLPLPSFPFQSTSTNCVFWDSGTMLLLPCEATGVISKRDSLRVPVTPGPLELALVESSLLFSFPSSFRFVFSSLWFELSPFWFVFSLFLSDSLVSSISISSLTTIVGGEIWEKGGIEVAEEGSGSFDPLDVPLGLMNAPRFLERNSSFESSSTRTTSSTTFLLWTSWSLRSRPRWL